MPHDDSRQDRDADLRPAAPQRRGICAAVSSRDAVLPIVAAIETYSRHPLAGAIVQAATDAGYALPTVEWIREEPGVGLHAQVGRSTVLVTNRAYAATRFELPASPATGLECVVLIDDRYAATFRFHDMPRAESHGFVGHLGPKHEFTRVLLVSGDRAAEVRRLADAGRHRPDPCGDVAGRKGRQSCGGKRSAPRRCSSATGSTTRRR